MNFQHAVTTPGYDVYDVFIDLFQGNWTMLYWINYFYYQINEYLVCGWKFCNSNNGPIWQNLGEKYVFGILYETNVRHPVASEENLCVNSRV